MKKDNVRAIIPCLVLIFAISWTAWGTMWYLDLAPGADLLSTGLWLIGGSGPTIGAAIFLGKKGGIGGVKKTQKGGKRRPIHFLLKRKESIKALNNYIGFRETGPIFTFDRHRAWRLCKRAGDRVNVFPDEEKNLHPHLFRHMHATHLLLDYEFNIRVIQKDLGHSNLDITSGYLSVSPEDIRKEAEEKIEEK